MASFGCKKKGGSDAIAKMEGFQKSMCECKDKACADKVSADMASWGTEMAKTAGKDQKPDPEMVKKSADIMTKYTECMTKLMMAGAGADPAKPSETPTEAKPADPAPAAASGTCPDGFTQNSKGGFCIKLPAGTKGDGGAGMAQGDGKTMRYSWAGGEKGSDWGISVDVRPMSEFYPDNMERVKQPPYQGKLGKEGKIGDTGEWASGESGPPPKDFAQRRWIKSVNKNDKMQLSCDISRASGTGAPTEDEVFEACKSIAFAK
jgi:hypothetical protein